MLRLTPNGISMVVCINGQFVPEADAVVSAFDRGFSYGDGLFETLRVEGGIPCRFAAHFERLERGASFLKIQLPFSKNEIEQQAIHLIARNGQRAGVLRLQVSRGPGERGYSIRTARCPTYMMSVRPAPQLEGEPEVWRLRTSPWRVSSRDPLLQFKTTNKLLQVLARADAEAQQAEDALFLNESGHVTETTCSNLFWVCDRAICTPPIASGLLPGVTRAALLDLCRRMDIACQEMNTDLDGLKQADGVFVTFTTRQIVEVVQIDDSDISRSNEVQRLREALIEDLLIPRTD